MLWVAAQRRWCEDDAKWTYTRMHAHTRMRTSHPHPQKRFLYYFYFNKCAVVCAVVRVVVCVVGCVVDCPKAQYPRGFGCVVSRVVRCAVVRVARCVVGSVKRPYSSADVSRGESGGACPAGRVGRGEPGGSAGPQRSAGGAGANEAGQVRGSERRRAGAGSRWLAVMGARLPGGARSVAIGAAYLRGGLRSSAAFRSTPGRHSTSVGRSAAWPGVPLRARRLRSVVRRSSVLPPCSCPLQGLPRLNSPATPFRGPCARSVRSSSLLSPSLRLACSGHPRPATSLPPSVPWPPSVPLQAALPLRPPLR